MHIMDMEQIECDPFGMRAPSWTCDAAAYRVFAYLCVCIFVCDYGGAMGCERPFIGRAWSCHDASP